MYDLVMQHDELMWLSGLLEGEGYFGLTGARGTDKRYPVISVSMTDKDVIERAAAALGTPVNGPYQPSTRPNARPYWTAKVTGRKAWHLLLELRPHMGLRRRTKIQNVMIDATAPVYGVGGKRRTCSP